MRIRWSGLVLALFSGSVWAQEADRIDQTQAKLARQLSVLESLEGIVETAENVAESGPAVLALLKAAGNEAAVEELHEMLQALTERNAHERERAERAGATERVVTPVATVVETAVVEAPPQQRRALRENDVVYVQVADRHTGLAGKVVVRGTDGVLYTLGEGDTVSDGANRIRLESVDREGAVVVVRLAVNGQAREIRMAGKGDART